MRGHPWWGQVVVSVMRGAFLSSRERRVWLKEESNSGRVVGRLVISCEVERSDMTAGRQIELMRRYVKVVVGGGVVSDVDT